MQRNCSICCTEFTAKRSTAMYCSGRCRVYAHRAKQPIMVNPDRYCQTCDTVIFGIERPDKLYCSNKCRQAAWRANNTPLTAEQIIEISAAINGMTVDEYVLAVDAAIAAAVENAEN